MAVALLNMPFGSLVRPPLSLALFKAQLAEVGISVAVHHLHFLFAQKIGFALYETLANFKGVDTQLGEWLFTQAAWRRPFGPSDEEFFEQSRHELHQLPRRGSPKDHFVFLQKVRSDVVPAYLEASYQLLVRNGVPKVVGFTCTFFQTIAALALGHLLKERHPEIRLVFGGACCHGEMGQELFAKVPFIDALSTGEADDVIVPLFQALEAGAAPRGLQGILYRHGGESLGSAASTPVSAEVLEQLPDPDFSEFYEGAKEVGLFSAPSWQERVALPFEASRGCWWGQKRHCTFCGLNGEGMSFRKKSASRVLKTLRALCRLYRPRRLMATDNILSMDYFQSLLPQLAEAPLQAESGEQPTDLFFEIKANLNRRQILALREAGALYVQPGIESLSSHLLERLNKGVSALQNVFLLKCCAEYGIVPLWSLLIGIPGERTEDYEEMERWIPLLFHLRPPAGGARPIECHRFSPYFFEREKYVTALRPAPFYRALFPEDTFDLFRVGYYFDATWKETLGELGHAGVVRLVEQWRKRWQEDTEQPRLTMQPQSDGGLLLEDSREGELETRVLRPKQAAVYRAIGDMATPKRVHTLVSQSFPEPLTQDEIRTELEQLCSMGLALREDDHFLGLAVFPWAPTQTAAARRSAMRPMPRRLRTLS